MQNEAVAKKLGDALKAKGWRVTDWWKEAGGRPSRETLRRWAKEGGGTPHLGVVPHLNRAVRLLGFDSLEALLGKPLILWNPLVAELERKAADFLAHGGKRDWYTTWQSEQFFNATNTLEFVAELKGRGFSKHEIFEELKPYLTELTKDDEEPKSVGQTVYDTPGTQPIQNETQTSPEQPKPVVQVVEKEPTMDDLIAAELLKQVREFLEIDDSKWQALIAGTTDDDVGGFVARMVEKFRKVAHEIGR